MPDIQLTGAVTYHTLTRGFKQTDGRTTVTDDEWAKLQKEVNPNTGVPMFSLITDDEASHQALIDAGVLPAAHGPDYSNSSRPGAADISKRDIDTAAIRKKKPADITPAEQAELDAEDAEANDPRFPRPNVPQFTDRGDPNSAEGFQVRIEEKQGTLEGDPNLGVPANPEAVTSEPGATAARGVPVVPQKGEGKGSAHPPKAAKTIVSGGGNKTPDAEV